MNRSLLAVVALAASLLGCRHLSERNDPGLLRQLSAQPGGHLSGTVVNLGPANVLDDRDFAYAIAISPRGDRAAFTHLGAKSSQLALATLGPPPSRTHDLDVNGYEFDLEDVAFSPDGRTVAVVSRDGSVRSYDAETGKLGPAYLTDEPLVALAFSPDGRYLAVGSADGLVTVLAFPALTYSSELRVHRDEIRALAFDVRGNLFSGSWDRSIARVATEERELDPATARMRFTRSGDYAIVRANFADRAVASVTFDARRSASAISSALARTLGFSPEQLTEHAQVQSPLGTVEVKLTPPIRLAFKSLVSPALPFQICDACLPAGAEAVLGAGFLEQVQVTFDESAREALLRSQVPSTLTSPMTGLGLTVASRHEYPDAVNDITVDAAGARLGVAFSAEKALRTRAVYEQEKKKIELPLDPRNAGALVDAASLEVLSRFEGHRGVVSTCAVSPDGKTVASGGWDRIVRVQTEGSKTVQVRELGWALRRVRFSRDGRLLGVAAWTPQNAVGDQRSAPSAIVYEPVYAAGAVVAQ